jgi:hypothetical protein
VEAAVTPAATAAGGIITKKDSALRSD